MKLMWICLATSVSLVTLVILESVEAQIKRFTNFEEFLTEVKLTADTLLDYVTKIQALFCPNQPVCGIDRELDKGNVLATLPTELSIDNVTVKLGEIAKSVGVCCLPCSCDDSCWQQESCCPTKTMLAKVTNDTNVALKSECIVASVRSYSDKSDVETYHLNHQYRMITNCFHDNTNDTNHTLVAMCHRPDAHSMTDSVPVTSQSTGYTYWNYACAACNGDYGNLIEWAPVVLIKQVIPYFSNSLRMPRLPDTYEQMLQLLNTRKVVDIIYIRPAGLSAQDSRCVTEDSFHEEFCRNKTLANEDWLFESCRRFYWPVLDNKASIYTNIFCFVCLTSVQLDVDGPSCTTDEEIRRWPGSITAILNYKAEPETAALQDENRMYVKGTCNCTEIYDPYLNICRPLFCSAGEIRIGCRCIVLLRNFTGLPVALMAKVKPTSEQPNALTSQQLRKLRVALEEALEATAMNTIVEVAVTLKQENVKRQTYLCMAIAQSEPGFDTRLAMRPFLKYLDTGNKLDLKVGKLHFSLTLTIKAKIWIEPSQNYTPFVYKGYWLGSKTNKLVQIYATFAASRTQVFKCQNMSRLLYCKQVELNNAEYFMNNSIVMINVTEPMISISDYYALSPSRIRVCADMYVQAARGLGVKSARALCTMLHAVVLFASLSMSGTTTCLGHL